MNYNLIDFEGLKNQLIQNGQLDINIISDSMIPDIEIEEKLKVYPIQLPLKRFDICVYWQNNRLVCHFLWQINTTLDFYIFKSLKHPRATDPAVKAHQILGIVSNKKIKPINKMRVYLYSLFTK